MVVAAGVAIGGWELIEPRADLHRFCEIHDRVLHRLDLAGGYAAAIDGGIVFGGYHQLVIENRPAARPREIEIGVVGQVDRGSLVRLSPVADDQLIEVGELVDNPDIEIAGIALFPIGAPVAEVHPASAYYRGLPDPLVEPLDAAVQVIGAVVLRQGVLLVTNLELAARDPVGNPPGGGSEIGMTGKIAVESIKAQDHVFELSIAVGNMQLGQQRAVGHDLRLDAVLVDQCVDVYRLAFFCLAEGGHGDPRARYRAGSQQEEARYEAENPGELHGYAPW